MTSGYRMSAQLLMILMIRIYGGRLLMILRRAILLIPLLLTTRLLWVLMYYDLNVHILAGSLRTIYLLRSLYELTDSIKVRDMGTLLIL